MDRRPGRRAAQCRPPRGSDRQQRAEYWKGRTTEAEKALLPLLEREAIKAAYTHGHTEARRICPDNWNMDSYFLERPGAGQVQLDFLYDDRNNVALYHPVQAFPRKRQPKALIFRGQGDLVFTREGGEACLRDLPGAQLHRLQSGHFAVEDHLEYISRKIVDFDEGLWEEEGSG